MFYGPILLSLLFRGAYLRGAYLWGAYLRGGAITDFYGVCLFDTRYIQGIKSLDISEVLDTKKINKPYKVNCFP